MLKLNTMNDHDLLAGGLNDLMSENCAAARRNQRLVEFYRRRARRHQDTDDPRNLTARQETTVEVSELWALSAGWVRRHLNNAIWVDEHYPELRDLALDGRVDPYRSALIAETARTSLDTDEEYAALVRRLNPFLTRHLRPGGVLACTYRQLRNKLAYEIRVLRAADAEASYRNAHECRDVTVSEGPYGISWLTVGATTDQIALAAQRLTLSARVLRGQGDPRTIAQIRADLAIGLLTGEVTDTPVPQYARPVINLTVPAQTVMGLSDDPGVLSGGLVIPAALARMIAQRPGATWHRMLTDPAGKCVELSTERYQPTQAIWEQVVGNRPTCFRPGCDHASTTCDLDHRLRWPEGATSPANLWPACRTDHRVKHAPGFSIEQTSSGSFALRTAAGFVHEIPEAEHPASTEFAEVPREIQFSATEIHEALQLVRERAAENSHDRVDLHWEYDLDWRLSYDPAA